VSGLSRAHAIDEAERRPRNDARRPDGRRGRLAPADPGVRRRNRVAAARRPSARDQAVISMPS
jgi:hypothetical protein